LVNVPWCGDGIKNLEEECDGIDGVTDHYTCTSTCTLQYIPYCGDNIVNQDNEQCDDGNAVNGDGCSVICQTESTPRCGDGICNNGETCSTCASDCPGTCGGGGGGGGGGGDPYPALAIMKIVAESSTNPGGILNYTIKVKNNGYATAKNVILKDALPIGFTFQEDGMTEKEWSLGDIAYGVEKITTFKVVVGTGVTVGDYKNVAIARADNHSSIFANVLTPVIIGQVLGARTELPNTGTDPILIVIAGLSIIITSLLTLLWFQRKIKFTPLNLSAISGFNGVTK